ncbi:hypothetical protein [Treponema putidum]|uniref:hypothetical protein n=1 Tax=Treponema putidum TaxID=221027 RepID=UPI003D9361BF
MEFDKSKVYTALNADELKIGSKCIFANTIADLRNMVQDEDARYYMSELTQVFPDMVVERFEQDDTEVYALAYLIEPPAEPKYRPFTSIEKAKEIIAKYGGWVKAKMIFSYLVTAYDSQPANLSVLLADNWYSLQELYHNFVFADDGSPCGELVKE